MERRSSGAQQRQPDECTNRAKKHLVVKVYYDSREDGRPLRKRPAIRMHLQAWIRVTLAAGMVAMTSLGAAQVDRWAAFRKLGDRLRDERRFRKSEDAYAASLKVAEAHGAHDPRVAASLHSLALLYFVQRKYTLAAPLYRRSLRMLEKNFGADHPELVVVLDNLAEVYSVQGRRREAEPLYRRIVSILQKAYGGDDERLREPLGKLAKIYFFEEQLERAEQTLRRLVYLTENHLGGEDPALAKVLNDLGVVYQRNGKPALAERQLERSLRIRRNSLGEEHPAVGETLTALSVVYRARLNFAQAEEALERALSMQEALSAQEEQDEEAEVESGDRMEQPAEIYREQRELDLAEGFLTVRWRSGAGWWKRIIRGSRRRSITLRRCMPASDGSTSPACCSSARSRCWNITWDPATRRWLSCWRPTPARCESWDEAKRRHVPRPGLGNRAAAEGWVCASDELGGMEGARPSRMRVSPARRASGEAAGPRPSAWNPRHEGWRISREAGCFPGTG